nr:MAG TPA: hypothetical protein [Caudoviricetes sp.]
MCSCVIKTVTRTLKSKFIRKVYLTFCALRSIIKA